MSGPPASAGTQQTGTREALTRTLRAFGQMLPIVVGMLLLSSLVLAWLPRTGLQRLFGSNGLLDVLLGTAIGGVAMGHPLAGYILGGELLAGGVSLIAVTALIVSWVTVGLVQLPAEALLLGRRFAVLRNLLCALSAIAIAYLTVGTLRLLG
jgi:uncharacterized membrane protein YraQ (UPF0718 family)